MEPRKTFETRSDGVHWEVRSHDSRLMTPDRHIAKGVCKTKRLAEAEANVAWVSFIDSLKDKS